MKILLTGTPGTGKTSVAASQDRFQVIDLKEYAEKRDLGEQGEEFVVDVNALQRRLASDLENREDYLLEGHFAHRLEGDVCVVLRCDPAELKRRLGERDYPGEKIRENAEAEALDLVLQEAVQEDQLIVEIDTTGREASEVAEEMIERIEEEDYGYGQIDFSDWL